MYVKNSNFVLFLALAVVVGFGASFLIKGVDAQSDLASGDISKAAKYSNQKEDPALTVIEEKLKNDQEFLSNTKDAMDFLNDRVSTLSELTDKTIELCSGIPEFESLMTEIKSLNAKSYNTGAALANANAGLEKLAAGKSAPEYELYSNNAYLGFNKIENQMSLGQRFYDTASAYLEEKDGDEYKDLADLALVWLVYCTQDACLNASEEDAAYWEGKYSELDGMAESVLGHQAKAIIYGINKDDSQIISDQNRDFVLNSKVLDGFIMQLAAAEVRMRAAAETEGRLNVAAEGVNLRAGETGERLSAAADAAENLRSAAEASQRLNVVSIAAESLSASFAERSIRANAGDAVSLRSKEDGSFLKAGAAAYDNLSMVNTNNLVMAAFPMAGHALNAVSQTVLSNSGSEKAEVR